MTVATLAEPSKNQPSRISAFNRTHLLIVLVLWFPLNPIALSLYRMIAMDGIRQSWSVADGRQFVVFVSASILGPFTAAVEGRNRIFCLDAGARYLPICAGAVFLGALIQLVWRPDSRIGQAIRNLIWATGWFVWFASAFVSILNNSG